MKQPRARLDPAISEALRAGEIKGQNGPDDGSELKYPEEIKRGTPTI
jgi:hypothetical protein